MMWSNGDLLQAGKYRIIRQIGGGGFGLTYLAEDCFLDRQVVIKAPNQQFQADQEYKKFIRRFQREGQVLAKFEEAVYVLHAFEKKTQKTSKRNIELGIQRYQEMIQFRQKRAGEIRK